MSGITLSISGLEDLIERIVDERVRAALAEHEPDQWSTANEAADCLGIAVSTVHDLACDGRLPRRGEKVADCSSGVLVGSQGSASER